MRSTHPPPAIMPHPALTIHPAPHCPQQCSLPVIMRHSRRRRCNRGRRRRCHCRRRYNCWYRHHRSRRTIEKNPYRRRRRSHWWTKGCASHRRFGVRSCRPIQRRGSVAAACILGCRPNRTHSSASSASIHRCGRPSICASSMTVTTSRVYHDRCGSRPIVIQNAQLVTTANDLVRMIERLQRRVNAERQLDAGGGM